MSFRTDAVRGIRMDGRLKGVPEGEDTEFCARLKPGTRLLIAPRARLIHKKSPASRANEHWLRRYAYANRFLCRTLTRRNPWAGVYFAWLCLGCALVATFTSVRRLSFEPWRALGEGLRTGGE